MDNKKRITALDLCDHSDAITAALTSAVAIMDCVRVLTALASLPEQHDISKEIGVTGGGYVCGVCVRDATLPQALYHAIELISDAEKRNSKIIDLVRSDMKEDK